MYQEKIDKLKKELADLENKQAKLNALPPAISVAFQLHELTCTWNHTDGCAWYYEKDEDYTKRGTTRNRYYTKAVELLKIEPDANKLIRIFSTSRHI